MDFYSRYEKLCSEFGYAAQSQKMLDIAGVSSPSVTGWKKGASPKIEVLCRLSAFFKVTTDYLLGLSELRCPNITLSKDEQELLAVYRAAKPDFQRAALQLLQLNPATQEKENLA